MLISRFKKWRLSAILIMFSLMVTQVSAQTVIQASEPCGFDHIHEHLLSIDPEYARRVADNEKLMDQILNGAAVTIPQTGPVYTVPVVVHVIHLGEALGTGSNISDAQVQSAITALNEDFRKMTGTNGDGNGVDVEIEFCLAERDPNGNATTGIVRVNGTGTCFGGSCYDNVGIVPAGLSGTNEMAVKALSTWPNTEYYNIWIVSEINNNGGGAGIQGYAYFPGASPAVDGSVILHNAFGTTGNLKGYTNMNRVATHELGHGFNLYHTFEGDAGGTSCPPNGSCTTQGDHLCDTPPHIRSASNCNTGGTNSCDGGSPNTLFVNNYMDYSNQTCQDMFTSNQKDRMRACLLGPRSSLLNSLACVPPCSTVTAGFTASTISAPVGTTINFTNTSTGATSYQWTIDGNTYTTTNASYTFNTAGSYTVCLEASDANCADVECLGITINPPGPCENAPNTLDNGNFESPSTNIGGGNNGINNNLDGWFVSHGSPTIASLPPRSMWMWSYSNTGEGVFNCYNFEQGEEYIICFDLRTNSKGNGAMVNVRATDGLTAATSTATTLPTPVNELIWTDPIANYNNTAWTHISVPYTPSANYTQIWFYPLMVNGPGGSPAQAEMRIDNVIIEKVDPTKYTISPDATICPPATVQLLATGGQSYTWSPATGLSCTNCPNPIASPTTTTTYTVLIDDSLACGPVTRTVTVNVDCGATCQPVPDFTWNANLCQVSFSGTNTGDPGTYQWDFGDGNMGSGQNPTHTYSASGTYNVCLTIVCDNNQSVTICKSVTVDCYCPCDMTADFTYVTNVCDVQFTETTTGSACTDVLGYYWDFGDGNQSNAQNPLHTYATSGTYNVCLTTVGYNGDGECCTDTVCYNVTVDCDTCRCDITADFVFGATDCEVNFGDMSTKSSCTNITSWIWDFGDGNGSNLQNPTHTYSASGSYTVCLIVTGTDGTDTCQDTICYTVDVNCKGCQCDIVPDFRFTVERCTVHFSDLSVADGCQIVGWHWDFGDGTSSSVQNPSHTYSSAGIYTVCLTVTAFDGTTTCSETICYQVEVEDCEPCDCNPKPDFQFVVEDCNVFFGDLSTSDCEIVGWSWDFGDGNTSTLKNPAHTYQYAGTYTVCLTITIQDPSGQLCYATICKTVVVTNCDPSPFMFRQFTGSNETLPFDVKVYPNPTSGDVFVEFDIPEEMNVEIAVFGSSAQQIKSLVDAGLEEGKHTVEWSPSEEGVASGVYYIMIRTGDKVKYEKVVFEK